MTTSLTNRERYHTTRAEAHRLYPAVFTARGAEPLPLRIGVRSELAALADLVGLVDLERFMSRWTGRPEYLAVIGRGGPRYGLDGLPEGEVTSQQMATALLCLSRTGPARKHVLLQELNPAERTRRQFQSSQALLRNRQVSAAKAAEEQAAASGAQPASRAFDTAGQKAGK